MVLTGCVKVVLVLSVLFCGGSSVPKNGKDMTVELSLLSVSDPQKEVSPTSSCFNIGLFTGSTIQIGAKTKDLKSGPTVLLKVNVFRTECANLPAENCGLCPPVDNSYFTNYKPVATTQYEGSDQVITIESPEARYVGNTSLDICDVPGAKPAEDPSPVVVTEPSENPTTVSVTTNGTEAASVEGAPVKREAGDNQPKKLPPPPSMTINTESGVYVIQVMALLLSKDGSDQKQNLTTDLTISVNVRNPHGYLSAVDFPALVFYGTMTGVYALYAIGWLISLACNYTDLVRLQFWVLGVVIIGFLEKALFLAEYDQANQGNSIHYLIILAVAMSALKRALSRMLLVIVALGYGIVKPRLGDSLSKVVGAGVIYWLLATINGVLRARNETAVSNNTAVLLSYGLLILIDLAIMFWIFSATVETRRALRIRKNFVKLASYNHFAYTLIFSLVAALGFIIWDLFAHIYPANGCLTDWGEVWLHDCFWHVLFAIILGIIMVIWRPGLNKKRFAYSLVDDEETDDHIEQGRNKNFDSVKMRQVAGSTSEPPQVSTQAEDDLRWVEENLPTSAIDKALPLILDSDEELMTTKFESSKMN